MKDKFVNYLTDFVLKNKECDETKIKIIRYGLEGFYTSVTKLLGVLIVVLILDIFKEFLALFAAYILVRRYSFGLHASSSLRCWLITLPIYVGGSLIIKYLSIPIYISYAIWLLAFISFVLWAPADTPKRPLIRTNLRKQQKVKTCIVTILYLIILFFVKNQLIGNAITIALLVQSIMVNPVTYKITKTQFNNYKLYQNKV